MGEKEVWRCESQTVIVAVDILTSQIHGSCDVHK